MQEMKQIWEQPEEHTRTELIMDLLGKKTKYLKSSFSVELVGKHVYYSGDPFFSCWESVSQSPTTFLVNTTMNQRRNKPAVSLAQWFFVIVAESEGK